MRFKFSLNNKRSPDGLCRVVTPAARSHLRVNKALGVSLFNGRFFYDRTGISIGSQAS